VGDWWGFRIWEMVKGRVITGPPRGEVVGKRG